MSSNNAPRILVAVAALAVAGGAVYFLLASRREEPARITVEAPGRTGTPVAVARIEPTAAAPTNIAPPPPSPTPSQVYTLPHEDAAPTFPAPSPTMDPEDQPRNFHVADFTKGMPEGFTLEGVQWTEKGFQLAPGKAGEPRTGVVTSAVVTMESPRNSIGPLWKEDLPEGTSVLFEIAISPDGKTWGEWLPLIGDEELTGDIHEFYPDGRPNPHYGYTSPGPMNWAADTWQAFRYRATLSSATEQTPTLEAVRVFYQDSTMGEGRTGDIESQNVFVPGRATSGS